MKQNDQKPLKKEDYERKLRDLHGELVKPKEWAKHVGAKVCIVFEGGDGKGGVIKATTKRVSHRTFRVVALPPPTEREKSQMYVQRYLPHLPAAGEIVIFDSSWYNRARVERVMDFCSEEQGKSFLQDVSGVERANVDSGTILLKLAGSRPKRANAPDAGAHRRSAEDLETVSHGSKIILRWHDYSRARDEMFRASDTAWPPSYAVCFDDRRQARLNIISHILSSVPYEAPPREKIELLMRQNPDGYEERDFARN